MGPRFRGVTTRMIFRSLGWGASPWVLLGMAAQTLAYAHFREAETGEGKPHSYEVSSANAGFLLCQSPCMKSGHWTVEPPSAIDFSDSGQITLISTES